MTMFLINCSLQQKVALKTRRTRAISGRTLAIVQREVSGDRDALELYGTR